MVEKIRSRPLLPPTDTNPLMRPSYYLYHQYKEINCLGKGKGKGKNKNEDRNKGKSKGMDKDKDKVKSKETVEEVD